MLLLSRIRVAFLVALFVPRLAVAGALVPPADLRSPATPAGTAKQLHLLADENRRLRSELDALSQQLEDESTAAQSIRAAAAASAASHALVSRDVAELELSTTMAVARVAEANAAAAAAQRDTARAVAEAPHETVAELALRGRLGVLEQASNEALRERAAADAIARLDMLHAEDALAVARDSARISAEAAAAVRIEVARRATAEAAASAAAQARVAEIIGVEHVRAREAAAAAAATTSRLMESLSLAFDRLGVTGAALLSREYLPALLSAALALAAGAALTREAAALLRAELARRLGAPVLVRETSIVRTFCRCTRGPARGCKPLSLARCQRRRPPFHGDDDNLARAFDDVVLPAASRSAIVQLAHATASARARGSPLRSALFHGPPGAGKTMVARRLALSCGLDYAIISGGDVAPLGAAAVTELHRLFDWARSSPTGGLVLLIDEAEVFLGRRGMTCSSPEVLSALLAATGGARPDLMLLVATNQPENLDDAVLDRLDEEINFPIPDAAGRVALGRAYFALYLGRFPVAVASTSPKATAKVQRATVPMSSASKRAWCGRSCRATPTCSLQVADDLTLPALQAACIAAEGLSARQMSRAMLALQAAAYAGARGEETATATLAMMQHIFELSAAKVLRRTTGSVATTSSTDICDSMLLSTAISVEDFHARKTPKTLRMPEQQRVRCDVNA